MTCKVIIDLPYGLPLRRLNGTLGLLNPPHHVSGVSLLHCHLYFFLEWLERSLWACSTIEVGRASVWGEFSQWISESHETPFRSWAIYQRQKDKSALMVMSWWPSQWLKTESGFTPKRCRCCSPRMPIIKVQCIFTRPETTSPEYSTAIGWWRETYNAFIQLCEWFLGWPTSRRNPVKNANDCDLRLGQAFYRKWPGFSVVEAVKLAQMRYSYSCKSYRCTV